ncbi:MAG: hypothetical protein ABFS86_07135 [Planctomycetota bacterium]
MASENEIPDEEGEPSYELEPIEDDRPLPDRPGAAAEFLEVEEPEPGPLPPPEVPPADKLPPGEPEEADDSPEPPRVQPFEVIRFLLWPLRKGCGDDFAVVLFVLLVVLSGGWMLQIIPDAGPILQALVAFAAATYLFTYLVKLVRATAEGRPAPVVWVRPEEGDPGVGDGIRAALLFVAHMLPAVIVGCAAKAAWAAIPLVLLGWAFWPATLLNLAAAGTVEAVNPVATVETAMLRRGIYFRIVIPGLFFSVAAFLSSSLIGGVWFGLAMWLCLVYTAQAMGSLAFHDPKMARRVRRLSGIETDDDEEFPPESVETPEEE